MTEQDIDYLESTPSEEAFLRQDSPTLIKETPEPEPASDRTRSEALSEEEIAANLSSNGGEGDPCDKAFSELLRAYGQHPDQIEERKAQRTISCAVCDATGTGGSPSSTIQCSRCHLCSHWSCIKEHFGPSRRDLLVEDDWSCPGRCDKSVPIWTDGL